MFPRYKKLVAESFGFLPASPALATVFVSQQAVLTPLIKNNPGLWFEFRFELYKLGFLN